MYGVYINDWISVACFWTNRIDEGKGYINEILENADHCETFKGTLDHYKRNLEHFNNLEKESNNA